MPDRRSAEVDGSLSPLVHQPSCAVHTLDTSALDADADQATLGVRQADHDVGERPAPYAGALALEPLTLGGRAEPVDALLVGKEAELLERRLPGDHAGMLSRTLRLLQ